MNNDKFKKVGFDSPIIFYWDDGDDSAICFNGPAVYDGKTPFEELNQPYVAFLDEATAKRYAEWRKQHQQ